MQTPSITTLAIATAAAAGGVYKIDMRGVDRASLQIHATLTGTDTDVVTLKLSNDNVNFNTFAVSKTVTFTGGGTVDAIFELGSIDYAFLEVAYATPSANTVTLVGTLYATPTTVRVSN